MEGPEKKRGQRAEAFNLDKERKQELFFAVASSYTSILGDI